MIFVTLGSQKFQFNRLLKAIDELIITEKIAEIVIAQIGYSDYKPKNYQYKEFMTQDEYLDDISKADIVITHGGTGAIITAMKKNKKVIAVPRLAKYGEHVDDHQLQIVNQFKELNFIYACLDCKMLTEALDTVRKTEYSCYQSNTHTIIHSIIEFIER